MSNPSIFLRAFLAPIAALNALALIQTSVHAAPAHIPHFRITDVGLASSNYGVYINNKDQIAGTGDIVRANRTGFSAFFWERGHRIAIGGTSNYPNSSAAGINNLGWVVGTLDNTVEGADMVFDDQIFVWKGGKPQNLGSPAGSDISRANGINDLGEIVGTRNISGSPNPADPASTAPQAVSLLHGIWTDLGGDAVSGINNKGQISGSGTIQDGSYHGLIWADGQTTDLGKADSVEGINNRGEAILINGSTISLWQNGKTIPLSLPAGFQGIYTSTVMSLNDNDQIVGTCLTSTNSDCKAILWENGKPINLNTVTIGLHGWVLEQATCINDKGEIVGIGKYQNAEHAFLLKPVYH